MAMAVKMRTKKQRLLMSFIRFCPMGSVPGFDSFMGFLSQKKKTQIIKYQTLPRSRKKEKKNKWCLGREKMTEKVREKKKGLRDNGDR